MRIIDFLRDKVCLHPFMIVFYYIIHYLIEYGDEAFFWYQPILYFIMLLLGVFLLDYLVRFFVSDRFNASYVTSAVIVLITFFQEIVSLSINILPFVIRRRYLLLLFASLIILLYFHLRKSRRRTQPNLFLNLLLFVYFTIDFLAILGVNTLQKKEEITVSQKSTIPIAQRPDIYLLLVDGYTSVKSLKKYYNFDDKPFINSLKEKGFYFANNAKSNYPYTVQTLSSALNLNYHKSSQKNISDYFFSLINSNKFVETLEENQYSIQNYSIFNFTNQKSPYHVKIWDNKKTLLSFYFSKSVIIDFLQPEEEGENLPRELNMFKSLDSSVIYLKKDIPKFIYAHSLLPHAPFYLNDKGVFDKGVNERNPGMAGMLRLLDEDSTNNTFGSEEKDKLMANDYINHIKFTNIKCLSSINTILKNQHRPTIIILMSDHGSRMLTEEFPQKEAIDERYTNFCTIYYSDRNYSKLYDSITPINVMRQVLNKSVGTKYPKLKDLSGLSIK